jgi:ABC-type bacteriocin/lantibiotic exporter with double-glycine peptidase domain
MTDLKIDIEKGFEMIPVSSYVNIDLPQDIAWKNINYKVGEGKHILTNSCGYVPSGKVIAIMGPSGAGKSSILNVLAGRSGL